MENKYLKFELDGATTTFTVLQKNTGKIWYSNPQGAKTDKLALTKEKNNMMSTLLLKYSTENGSDDTYDRPSRPAWAIPCCRIFPSSRAAW